MICYNTITSREKNDANIWGGGEGNWKTRKHEQEFFANECIKIYLNQL